MDYKELLEQLTYEDNCDVLDYIGDAVTAIENLMKYKDAVERMGNFGRLFVQYSGDPRGQMGHRGNRTDEIEDATMFSTIEDVEGDVWRPVLERALQSLIQRTKKAERERDAAVRDINLVLRQEYYLPCVACKNSQDGEPCEGLHLEGFTCRANAGWRGVQED